MKTVAQFPLVLIDQFESNGLVSQYMGEIDELTLPFDLASAPNLPDRDSRLVLHLGKFGRIGAWRGAMDAARRLSAQRLMAALPVVFLLKRIVMALLLTKIALRRHSFLQGFMHSLVTAVLRRFSRLASLRPAFQVVSSVCTP